MQPRKRQPWVRSSLLRTLWYLTVTIAGASISVCVSYATVRHFTRGMSFVKLADNATLGTARQLRHANNVLTSLANEYVYRFPLNDKAPSPTARLWINSQFRTQASAVRQQLESVQQGPLPADAQAKERLDALATACDRVLAMAAQPEDTLLRGRALVQARDAVRDAESWIEQSGAAASASEPAGSFSAAIAQMKTP